MSFADTAESWLAAHYDDLVEWRRHIHRHPARIRAEHRASREGRLVSVRMRILVDGGAYASSSSADRVVQTMSPVSAKWSPRRAAAGSTSPVPGSRRPPRAQAKA